MLFWLSFRVSSLKPKRPKKAQKGCSYFSSNWGRTLTTVSQSVNSLHCRLAISNLMEPTSCKFTLLLHIFQSESEVQFFKSSWNKILPPAIILQKNRFFWVKGGWLEWKIWTIFIKIFWCHLIRFWEQTSKSFTNFKSKWLVHFD